MLKMLLRRAFGLVLVGLIVSAIGLNGCNKKKETATAGTTENLSSPQTESTSPSYQSERTVDKALARNIDLLRSVKGVLKAELGNQSGKPRIKVYVTKKTAEVEKNIPDFIEGYPVVIEEAEKGEVK